MQGSPGGIASGTAEIPRWVGFIGLEFAICSCKGNLLAAEIDGATRISSIAGNVYRGRTILDFGLGNSLVGRFTITKASETDSEERFVAEHQLLGNLSPELLNDIVSKDREQSVVVTPTFGKALESSICTYRSADGKPYECITSTVLEFEDSTAALRVPQILGEELEVDLDAPNFTIRSWMKPLPPEMAGFMEYAIPPLSE